MYLLTVYSGEQLQRSWIWGLIIACKWVFDVKFWCIVHLRLHKVKNLISNSNSTLCTFSDRCLWPEFLYFSDSLHAAQHSWDTKNSRVCNDENFNRCFYKVIEPSSSQGVNLHGRQQYDFKSSFPEGFKLENQVQRPLLKPFDGFQALKHWPF